MMNMRKRILSLTAGGLFFATLLSSCITSYSVKLPQGSGEPSINWGGGVSPEDGSPPLTSLPLSIPGLEDLPEGHLFGQQSYLLPDGVDFSGFTPDGNYFIADFDKGLSKYNGMGKYLFMLDHALSDEELAEFGEMEAILTMLSDKDGSLTPEYVVYPTDEKSLRQIVVTRYNEQTGREESFLFDYVQNPIDGKLPEIPGVDNPTVSATEPDERYSTAWLEWLTTKDNGTLYHKIKEGCFFETAYASHPASPFSIVKGSKSSRFSLSYGFSLSSVAAFGAVDVSGLRWKIFYRVKDSGSNFGGFEKSPWKWYEDNDYYCFELEAIAGGMNPSLKFDLTSNSYQTIFIITDEKERILAWWQGDADWTMSSELFLAEAVDKGFAKDTRNDPITIPAPEPSEKYTQKWFHWLQSEDQGRQYPIFQGGLTSSSYGENYASSYWQIWPYDKGAQKPISADSRFGLALSVSGDLINMNSYRYSWSIFYRKAGTFDEFKEIPAAHYGYSSLGNRTIFYFDPLGKGMTLPSNHATKDFTYEIYFVATLYNSSQIVGWYRAEVLWNRTAEAYYKEAVNNSILFAQ